MAASFFSIPAIELEPSEAKAVAEAVAEVSRYYRVPGIDPKHAALASLAIVLVSVYGKRVPAILAGPPKKIGSGSEAPSAPAAGGSSSPAGAAGSPADGWDLFGPQATGPALN